jgi:hypothetical protein
MDANSHNLPSLKAENDLTSIYQTLNRDFEVAKAAWIVHCSDANVTLLEEHIKVRRIDYIPPRVGIMIDQEELYAGRCSIQQHRTDGQHHLLVGESEYYHFSSQDTEVSGPDRIREFSHAIMAYSNRDHNGVRLICDRAEGHKWIEALQKCVKNYSGISEIKLVSNTGSNFEYLIESSLEYKINVRVYTLDPNSAPKWAQDKIDLLKTNLKRFRKTRRGRTSASCTFHACSHPSTFRAAVIGERVVGLHTYNPSSDWKDHEPNKSPIRLIVSQDSAHYGSLYEMVDDYMKAANISGMEELL